MLPAKGEGRTSHWFGKIGTVKLLLAFIKDKLHHQQASISSVCIPDKREQILTFELSLQDPGCVSNPTLLGGLQETLQLARSC